MTKFVDRNQDNTHDLEYFLTLTKENSSMIVSTVNKLSYIPLLYYVSFQFPLLFKKEEMLKITEKSI